MEYDPEKTIPHMSLEDAARAGVEEGLAKLELKRELKGDPELDAIIDQVAAKEVEMEELIKRIGLAERIIGQRYERNGEVVVVKRIKPGLVVELQNPSTKTTELVYVGAFEGKLLDDSA